MIGSAILWFAILACPAVQSVMGQVCLQRFHRIHHDGILHALGRLRDLGHRGVAQMNGVAGLRQRDLLSAIATAGRRRGIGIIFPRLLEKFKKRNNN